MRQFIQVIKVHTAIFDIFVTLLALPSLVHVIVTEAEHMVRAEKFCRFARLLVHLMTSQKPLDEIITFSGKELSHWVKYFFFGYPNDYRSEERNCRAIKKKMCPRNQVILLYISSIGLSRKIVGALTHSRWRIIRTLHGLKPQFMRGFHFFDLPSNIAAVGRVVHSMWSTGLLTVLACVD